MSRVCRTCGVEQPLSEFYFRASANYREVTCQSCKYKAKLTYKNYNIKACFGMRRQHAAKQGLPFEITLDDILPLPTHCPVLGMELKPGVGRNVDSSPSIDRIRPELGYVPGNVVVMSLKANRIKNDATWQELEKVATFLRMHTEGLEDE